MKKKPSCFGFAGSIIDCTLAHDGCFLKGTTKVVGEFVAVFLLTIFTFRPHGRLPMGLGLWMPWIALCVCGMRYRKRIGGDWED